MHGPALRYFERMVGREGWWKALPVCIPSVMSSLTVRMVYSPPLSFSSLLTGDNILAVLKYLATSDMLPSSSKYRHGNMVFFDVLGLFVIAYPSRVGSIINSVVVMAVVLYLGKKLLQPKHKSKYFPLKLQCWPAYRNLPEVFRVRLPPSFQEV